uniref:Uncharacterized protein n=1 Tax=Glossina austeni TaxID=7395 RepID=A0A1A9UIA2_GLOAU
MKKHREITKLENENQFIINHKEISPIRSLKPALANKPILIIYERNGMMEAHADLSKNGFDAIFLQEDQLYSCTLEVKVYAFVIYVYYPYIGLLVLLINVDINIPITHMFNLSMTLLLFDTALPLVKSVSNELLELTVLPDFNYKLGHKPLLCFLILGVAGFELALANAKVSHHSRANQETRGRASEADMSSREDSLALGAHNCSKRGDNVVSNETGKEDFKKLKDSKNKKVPCILNPSGMTS